MLRDLIDRTMLTHYRSAAQEKGLSCPRCGSGVNLVPASIDQVITCPHCEAEASMREWIPQDPSVFLGQADSPPTGTKITRESHISGCVVWTIPASGKSGGLLSFAIVWCVISVVTGVAFLSASLTSQHSTIWFSLVFTMAFASVGLAMLYFALSSRYAWKQLIVDLSTVTLRRRLFRRAKEIYLPVAEVISVSQLEFYQMNYKPIHGIEIRGRNGGKIRFGTLLTAEEKAWLVADIREVLRFPSPPTPVPHKIVASEGKENFSLVIPHARRETRSLGITLILVGSFFAGVLITQSCFAPVGDRVLGVVIGIVFGGLSLVLLTGGTILCAWLWRMRREETRFEGTPAEVAIRGFVDGRVVKERSHPRPKVTDLRVSVCGSCNSKTMKRIELIVNKRAEVLAGWVEASAADRFAAEARAALGSPD